MAKVKWVRVCAKKIKGGLGIPNLQVRNNALLAKWWWRYATEENSLWRKVIEARYGQGAQNWIPNIRNRRKMSNIWREVIKVGEDPKVKKFVGYEGCRWVVGNGNSILFWYDRWSSDRALHEVFPRLFRLAINQLARVAEYAQNNSFKVINWSKLFSRPLLERDEVWIRELGKSLLGTELVEHKNDRII